MKVETVKEVLLANRLDIQTLEHRIAELESSNESTEDVVNQLNLKVLEREIFKDYIRRLENE